MPVAAIGFRTFPDIGVGPITLNTFGLLVAVGIVVGRWVARRALQDTDVDLEEFDRIVLRAVLVGLLGARAAWVVTHVDQIDSIVDVIAVWDGGLQFSGGFLAGIVAAAPWIRRQVPADRRRIADAAALGMAPGLAIGRIGCMAVGEHLGRQTDFVLGWRYLGGDVIEGPLTVGATYHNTSLYELLHLTLLFGLLSLAHRRGWLRVGDGRTAAIFLAWYGVLRSLTDLTRSADATVLGLTGAQWVAVAVLLPAAVMLWTRRAPEAAASA